MTQSLSAIQHYKGYSNIDSSGNYERFFIGLRERNLRSCSPGPLNYGMFAFLKIKLLPVEITYRGGPRGSLNKIETGKRGSILMVIIWRFDVTSRFTRVVTMKTDLVFTWHVSRNHYGSFGESSGRRTRR